MIVPSMKRIMLVDDDHINNFLTRRILSNLHGGLDIVAYTNPAEALTNIEGFRPDIIFLDLNMPVMNGWQFLEEFRAFGLKIPVLILSSSIDPLEQIKTMSYPEVKGFLLKPLLN